MRFVGLGRLLLAASFGLSGALIAASPDFAREWRPLPKWIAWHDALTTASGAMLLVCAIALLLPRAWPRVWPRAWPRASRIAALVLAAFFVVRMCLIQIPQIAAHPLIELTWYDLSENAVLIAGAWTVFSLLPRGAGALANIGSTRAGQIVFALALPAIGLSHVFYVGNTAPLIPSWLPFHVPLAYFTGAAHIAAGIGILFGILPRLAATLEAVMVSLFTLLIWVPMVSAAPANLGDWSEFCISTAIAGAAWAVAESCRGRPWGLGRAAHQQQ